MKNFKRSIAALAVVSALGMSVPAFADNNSGSIYGQAEVGKTITIKSPSTGFSRTVTVSESGRFNFPKLPTGDYVVTSSDGKERNVTVSIGSGSNIDFANQIEKIEVLANLSTIDTSSVESTTVFTSDQVDLLPISKDITSVALLAPGVVSGDSGFGNLASFGGSSVAENGYFINGFDVTNIRNFTSFANLPYDAVSQQQVKTGGYGAEYGRSLGGVVNLVTKRGTNEWTGGGAIYYSPESFRENGKDSVSQDPDLEYGSQYVAYRSANTFDYLSYNAYVSGPIIEDTLFFYGMFEGQKDEINTYGKQTSETIENTSPLYLLKIDWNITDDHLLEFTYIENEDTDDITPYANDDDVFYTGKHANAGESYSETTGGNVSIVNYRGYLTDDLTVSLLWGRMESTLGARSPLVGPGAECPVVFDRRDTPNSSQSIGCWGIAEGQFFTPDINVEPDEDIRESVRFSVDYMIGDHEIKIGYDREDFTSSKQGENWSGGEYWRWHVGQAPVANDKGVLEPTIVNGVTVPEGQVYVRHQESNTVSSTFAVENTAFYIEDKWQATDDLAVYLGLRSEGFVNKNADDEVFIEADNLLAPRLGFSWDINGDGSSKFFGTLGRYYIPVASNTNIRASGIEYSYEEYFLADSANEDPTTAAPTQLGAMLGERNVNGRLTAPDSRTLSATDLDPMHQDELILGYTQELDDYVVGAKFIYRDVKDGMDDYCSHQPFIDFAEDNGYDNFDYHSLASCMMINPNKDLSIALDLENDGNYTTTVVPKEYFGLVDYERTYTALELSIERPMNDGYYYNASYVLGKSEGNSEGYVNSTNEQEDAGLTQDLDNALFQHGAYGALPNDRRHTFKVYGAYQYSEEVTFSANASLVSGRPRSCQGFIPLNDLRDELGVDASGLATYGASSYYCDGVLTNRGDDGRTPWTKNLDVGMKYTPQWAEGFTFQVDIRNLLNFGEVTEYIETAEVGSAAAPELNPNYKAPVNFQTPRRVSFTARYNF